MTTIWILRQCCVDMINEAACWHPKETGGVLVGYISDSDVVVTRVIHGGPAAIRDKYYFEPDYDFQEFEIIEIFNNSQGVERYLGDWHSHPNGSCKPSKMDRTTLTRIAHFRPAELPNPIMLIIGNHGTELCAWQAMLRPRSWLRRYELVPKAIRLFDRS